MDNRRAPPTKLRAFSIYLAAVVLSANFLEAPTSQAAQFSFKITKGAGTPVCDSYLKRLNSSAYETPPYCDRPEVTTEKGFATLHRANLSDQEVHILYPRVSKFTRLGDQGSKEKDDELNKFRAKQGLPALGETVETIKYFRKNRELDAWRYAPPVDINNDGKVDNLVVWQGLGASPAAVPCGEVAPAFSSVPTRSSRLVYFLTPNSDRIDEKSTRSVFGHPGRQNSKRFQPIGNSIGILKYDNLVYFDTFFNSRGDFENKRANTSNIQNVLGLFLHRNGRTQQVCEYIMEEANDS